MTDQEKIELCKALIPLEVLCMEIKRSKFKELTDELQIELLKSRLSIRKLVFGEDYETNH